MAEKPAMRRITLDGELTIFTAAAIQEQLLAALADARILEVNLSKITEVDSAGLQLLIATRNEAAAIDTIVLYTGHSAAMLEALELAWLQSHLGENPPDTRH